jgi:hypothetical protein
VDDTSDTFINFTAVKDSTLAEWEFIQITLDIGTISAAKLRITIKDFGASAGAVYDVQDIQCELGSAATEYRPTTDDGTKIPPAVLNDRMVIINAGYNDGITIEPPLSWHLGPTALEAVVAWPSAYVFVDTEELGMISILAADSGSAQVVSQVTLGIMEKGEPSNTSALALKMYRHMRAMIEVIMDVEAGVGFAGYTMGAASPRIQYGRSVIHQSQMFADASVSLTFAAKETR